MRPALPDQRSAYSDPRKAALWVLNRLDEGRKTLDQVLDDLPAERSRLSRRDRALLNALVYGVLRWRGRLDWMIGYFSKTPLLRIDPEVLNILRLGAFQIVYLERVPHSAAVNTSVEMAKSVAAPWVIRFVNGVLRSVAGNYKSVSFPDPIHDPVEALAAVKSFPNWLIQRWLKRLGREETEFLCDAVNAIPPITVRTNTLRTSREKLIASFRNHAETIQETPYSPDGVSFRNPKVSIPEFKPFQDGWFQVQDEAAQLVSLLLDPQPGESVLDVCAGLGGKTGHLAQLINDDGKIVAMDKYGRKLQRLEFEMHRLGVSSVTPYKHDLRLPVNEKEMGRFNSVLLDAPCSGLGVLRRNPDAKWSVTEKDLRRNQKRQSRFLGRLGDLVLPDGVLVYAVCSTEPEETEAVVKLFLNQHPKFVINRDCGRLPETACSLMNATGRFITCPHLHNMDGFFAVRFKRAA